MDRNEYNRITRLISQTVFYLNHSGKPDQDDFDEVVSQTLLKLTPQLPKMRLMEPLHLRNFIRKTTRNVFWDYLKASSADLTGYRVKKRIKHVLVESEEFFSPFRYPDGNTLWSTKKRAGEPDTGTPPATNGGEKDSYLHQFFQARAKAPDNPPVEENKEESLTGMVKKLLSQCPFPVSVNDIYTALASATGLHERFRISLDTAAQVPGPGNRENGAVPNLDALQNLPSPQLDADRETYYDNLAHEFITHHVPEPQAYVYYLKYVAHLGYKEISQSYGITIQTAESRLSAKPAKKGFTWRLARFVQLAGLTVEETKNFLPLLNRKIHLRYGNNKRR